MRSSTIAPILLIAGLTLAGCSTTSPDASTTPTSTATSATAAETTTASPTTTGETTDATTTAPTTSGAETTATTSGTANSGAFDVNSAGEEEIASRLEQAGVPDSATWAKRIKENGPYTRENATAKIREIAQKYPMDLSTLNEIRRALGY